MTERNGIARILAEIEQQLATPIEGVDWVHRTNLNSLRHLQSLYTEAALAGSLRAKLRFTSGSVVGNSAPAHLLLRFVNEVNEAVIAATNRKLPNPVQKIDDNLRSRLGLWITAPAPGSVVFQVVSPPPEAPMLSGADDAPIPGIETESLIDRGLADVLDVLAEATSASEPDSERLVSLLRQLGNGAVAHLNRLAARTEFGDFTVSFEVTQGREHAVLKEFDFHPRDAAYLRSVIRLRELDLNVRQVEGWLTTASRRRSIFDIETEDGQVISGAVPTELRPAVAALFDKRVVADVEEKTDPGDPEGIRVRRRLVSLVEAAEPPEIAP